MMRKNYTPQDVEKLVYWAERSAYGSPRPDLGEGQRNHPELRPGSGEYIGLKEALTPFLVKNHMLRRVEESMKQESERRQWVAPKNPSFWRDMAEAAYEVFDYPDPEWQPAIRNDKE